MGPSARVAELGRSPAMASARALARRPDLWFSALGAGRSLLPRRWWRRRPFLPVPDRDWLRFRMTTAYGGDGKLDRHGPFQPDDLITWLEWRKAWPSRR